MWDGVSFIVGILVGMIIMVIIFWITYYNRVFIFTKCPNNVLPCLYDQYWNDPGNALNQNSSLQASDILFINSNQQMLYKRVPKSSACVPVSDSQTVTIVNPQWCQFTTQNGVTPSTLAGQTFQARNSVFESPLYTGTLGDGTKIEVLTDGNCQAIRSETNTTPSQDIVVRGGAPVLRWDANTQLTSMP